MMGMDFVVSMKGKLMTEFLYISLLLEAFGTLGSWALT